MTEAEIGFMRTHAKTDTSSWKRQRRVLLEGLGGAWLCQHLVSDFWPPEL